MPWVCCCRMSLRQVCEVVGTGVGRDRGHAPVLGGGETCSNSRSQALSVRPTLPSVCSR